MLGSGGHYELMRESEREFLFKLLSWLFPDPDNQPDWMNSPIPFAMMVAAGYAPQSFDPRDHKTGVAPFGILKLNICIFYNQYVAERIEGKMHKKVLASRVFIGKGTQIKGLQYSDNVKDISPGT